jgi:two-component system, sensor histidine kinase and response regulator
MMGFQNQLANLNRAVALERVGGDLELLQEIAQLFLEHSPELVDEMRAALANNDAKGLERAAHSLKGSVSNFGAEATHHAAMQLESIARRCDLPAAAEAFQKLERELNLLRPELAALAEEAATT